MKLNQYIKGNLNRLILFVSINLIFGCLSIFSQQPSDGCYEACGDWNGPFYSQTFWPNDAGLFMSAEFVYWTRDCNGVSIQN